MNSQFAVRVAVVSGIALIAFAAIFFRLWYVQVLSGQEYLTQAQDNRTREVTIQAPRGEILDRHGKILVGNRSALSLQVRADQLPQRAQARNRVLRKLSAASGIPLAKIKHEIEKQTYELPANPVTLARDVDRNIVFYVREHADELPGVTAQEVSVRYYPNGQLGANLFGFVAEVNADQLKEPQYENLNPGDQIGAAGLEAQYDNYVRGRNGLIEIPVDASGQPKGDQISEVRPETGDDLVLTLDKKIQQAGESAIARWGGGKPAAFVAMKVSDGSILGMGSYPSFDPGVYTPPVSFDAIKQLQHADGDPLFNKAIQSGYPTGSTFKAITGTAALESGVTTPGEVYSDTGTFQFGGVKWTNAGGEVLGAINMTTALQYSSDLYFYTMGMRMDQQGKGALQNWAADYGFGAPTGIDLPGEQPGLVPSPEWRNDLYEAAIKPDSPCGTDVVFDPARDCYEIADRAWGPGDNMNLSVGQGDLQATPLQLATAYAAIANGGTVVRPHLGMKVTDPVGTTEEEFTPAARRHLDISPTTLDTIREGLRGAAMSPGGTSYPVFGGYPVDICGKTGTAETSSDLGDQAWYASFAPCDDPKYVVVSTIEGGGFGAETAAPAAREIWDQILGIHESDVDAVSDTAAIAE